MLAPHSAEEPKKFEAQFLARPYPTISPHVSRSWNRLFVDIQLGHLVSRRCAELLPKIVMDSGLSVARAMLKMSDDLRTCAVDCASSGATCVMTIIRGGKVRERYLLESIDSGLRAGVCLMYANTLTTLKRRFSDQLLHCKVSGRPIRTRKRCSTVDPKGGFSSGSTSHSPVNCPRQTSSPLTMHQGEDYGMKRENHPFVVCFEAGWACMCMLLYAYPRMSRRHSISSRL